MSKTHGLADTRIYIVWRGIKTRCNCPSDTNYKRYGARGIKMCNEWENSFISFYNWAIANGYDTNAKRGECTLDRIDINGNYCPENCRWITNKEQAKNKRTNRYITYKNQTKILQEWANEYNVKRETLAYRLNHNWDIERALTTH